jgi:hypothetical protein
VSVSNVVCWIGHCKIQTGKNVTFKILISQYQAMPTLWVLIYYLGQLVPNANRYRWLYFPKHFQLKQQDSISIGTSSTTPYLANIPFRCCRTTHNAASHQANI